MLKEDEEKEQEATQKTSSSSKQKEKEVEKLRTFWYLHLLPTIRVDYDATDALVLPTGSQVAYLLVLGLPPARKGGSKHKSYAPSHFTCILSVCVCGCVGARARSRVLLIFHSFSMASLWFAVSWRRLPFGLSTHTAYIGRDILYIVLCAYIFSCSSYFALVSCCHAIVSPCPSLSLSAAHSLHLTAKLVWAFFSFQLKFYLYACSMFLCSPRTFDFLCFHLTNFFRRVLATCITYT